MKTRPALAEVNQLLIRKPLLTPQEKPSLFQNQPTQRDLQVPLLPNQLQFSHQQKLLQLHLTIAQPVILSTKPLLDNHQLEPRQLNNKSLKLAMVEQLPKLKYQLSQELNLTLRNKSQPQLERLLLTLMKLIQMELQKPKESTLTPQQITE